MHSNNTNESKQSRIVRILFKILRAILLSLVVLYGIVVMLSAIPAVQEQLSQVAARQLSALLDTPVSIKHITIGYPDRIILDDVAIDDKEANRLLQATRLSARFEWLPLLRDGRFSIHTAQLFGLQVSLNRQHPEAPLNIQFIIDKLASPKDSTSESKLDLRVNSLLIRRTRVNYDVMSEVETPEKFNPHHIAFNNINATISLKALKKDSINLHIKRLDLKEQSGFTLNGMEAHLKGGKKGLLMQDFNLKLPQSHLQLKELRLDIVNDSVPFERFYSQSGIESNSYLTPADIAPFVPALSAFNSRISIAMPTIKVSNEHAEMPLLRIASPKQELSLELKDIGIDIAPDGNHYVKATLKGLTTNESGLEYLMTNLNKASLKELPSNLKSVQKLKLSGKAEGFLSNIATNVTLETAIGHLETNATLGIDTNGKLTSYQGNIGTPGLNLKKLLGEKQKLGNASMELYFNGNMDKETPQVYVKGSIPTLEYNGYEYQSIHLDGIIKPYTYDGTLILDDPNISLRANGHADIINRWPNADMEISIRHFRPNDLMLTENRKGFEYNTDIRAHFSGSSLDDLIGELLIDSLLTTTPKDTFLIKNLTMNADIGADGGYRLLTIKSDFMKAYLEGEMDFKTLAEDFICIASKQLPSLATKGQNRKLAGNNNFTIDITLQNSKFYPYVLGIPLYIKPFMNIKGFINSTEGQMELTGNAHHLEYNGDEYEGTYFKYRNRDNESQANVYVSKKQQENERMTLILNARAANDSLKTRIHWGNDAVATYSGELTAEATFDWNPQNELSATIQINPSEVIINNSEWKVAESSIRIDSGYVHIMNFGAQNDTQHLTINGSLTENPKDSLIIDLNKIAVEYILDVVQFDAVDFAGIATGKIYINSALGDMKAHTRLKVDDFHFNNGLMGDMDVNGEWDKEIGILINADIREGDKAQTIVEGFVSPQQDSLDLKIKTKETNLAFLNSFIGGIFDNVEGRAQGDIHLYGPFKDLNLTGDAVVTASLVPHVLNTPLKIQQDTIRLRQKYIELPSVTIYDRENHTANITGRLSHQHFRNMRYNFHIAMNRFLFYNTSEYGDMPFYGQLYGTGNAELSGGGNQLNVGNAEIRTEAETKFVYNLSTPDALTDNHFVSFVDKTIRPQRIVVSNLDLFERDVPKNVIEESEPLDISINAEINVTPDAEIQVIMDDQMGAKAYGSGSIRLGFNSLGETNLNGEYTIERGIFNMSIEDIVHKDLQIQENSKVSFTGNGGEADLDLQAIYTVNSVSLSDLIPDASFNQNNVKVNCIIKMQGKLEDPTLSFDIDLPTVNNEEEQLVQSVISTEEQKQRQTLYLMTIGKFYTYDYAAIEGQQSSNTMSSLLSSTLSGHLNNLLSQAFNTNNWNFSSNFSTGQDWSEVEVEGILSGRMLNNRLLINGNFGYRENELRNSNFVGDFDIQYLLTRSGNIRLKGYNTTNDRYFAKQTLNTIGGGIIFKHEFNSWKDLFRWKKKK